MNGGWKSVIKFVKVHADSRGVLRPSHSHLLFDLRAHSPSPHTFIPKYDGDDNAEQGGRNGSNNDNTFKIF